MATIDLRKDYRLSGLRRKDLHADPFRQFDRWFQQALDSQKDEAHAMTLATADAKGRPSSRIVLLRSYDENGFVFYTNYESRKASQLAKNPHAALSFFWPMLERQVCIAGSAARISREDSVVYFKTRPHGNQLAAWVSHQSEVIPDRETLDDGLKRMEIKYRGRKIPLPPWWGGYCVKPSSIEFWQGRPNRLHDRFRYSRQKNGSWKIERLSP